MKEFLPNVIEGSVICRYYTLFCSAIALALLPKTKKNEENKERRVDVDKGNQMEEMLRKEARRKVDRTGERCAITTSVKFTMGC